jgi:hypothetical protein
VDALSMNTLRIVLVALTALAAVVAALFQFWVVAGVLAVSVAAHGAMWLHLYRQRQAEAEALHAGIDDLLRSEG